MSLREWILAGFLAAAAALVVAGVASFSAGAAQIVAGVLVALWAWLVLADDGGSSDE